MRRFSAILEILKTSLEGGAMGSHLLSLCTDDERASYVPHVLVALSVSIDL